ncbi:MAG: GGDEF domain-containing protein [Anaerolineales bacterium]|nr:GGDEF domain-containing protein [Anaerolineales bacterium]
MRHKSLRIYALFTRYIPDSYFIKLLIALGIGMSIPLVTSSILLLATANLTPDLKLLFFVLGVGATLVGALLAAWLLYALTMPIEFTRDALQKYLSEHTAPFLPTEYTDTAGQLMADVQFVVTQLDRYSMGLQNKGETDHLTNALSRGVSETRLRQEMEYAALHLQPFALALLDLDHFKEINDHYGLAVGDQCLRHIGNILRQNIRKNDWLGRWGGDEFILVMHDVDAQRLQHTLARLNEALVANPNPDLPPDMHLMVALSVGATILRPGDTPEALLAKADAALYRSKMEGRGQITVLDERINTPTKMPRVANKARQN